MYLYIYTASTEALECAGSQLGARQRSKEVPPESEFFIDNLLV